MSSSLITWAQFCSHTGTTGTTDQALFEASIGPAVSEAAERFCDRKFSLATEVEWASTADEIDGLWMPLRYPVDAFLSAYACGDGIRCTNGGQSDITITVGKASLLVGDADTLAYTTYSYTDYATLDELIDELAESDTSEVVWSLATGVSGSTSTKLLMPSTTLVLADSEGYVQVGIPTGATPRSVTDCAINVPAHAIAYRGGYSPLPEDLVRTIAQICQAAIEQVHGANASAAGLKSESIGKYAYSRADGVDVAQIVGAYASALSSWRRVAWA